MGGELSLRSSHFTALSLSISLSCIAARFVYAAGRGSDIFLPSVWEKRRSEKASKVACSSEGMVVRLATQDAFSDLMVRFTK